MIVDFDDLVSVLGAVSALSSAQQTLLRTIHPAVEQRVRDYLRFDPERQTHTEYLPQYEYARESSHLLLSHIPVRSLTSVDIGTDGRFGVGTYDESLVLGTDCWLETDGTDSDGNRIGTGAIVHVTAWPVEPGSIKVVYVAGYSAAELAGTSRPDASPIRQAVILTASKAYRTLLKAANSSQPIDGTLTGERLGDYSYTADAGSAVALTGMAVALPTEAMELLDSFVNYGDY